MRKSHNCARLREITGAVIGGATQILKRYSCHSHLSIAHAIMDKRTVARTTQPSACLHVFAASTDDTYLSLIKNYFLFGSLKEKTIELKTLYSLFRIWIRPWNKREVRETGKGQPTCPTDTYTHNITEQSKKCSAMDYCVGHANEQQQ